MGNPALDDLAFLAGEWRIEVSNAEWLADSVTVTGTLRVDWLDESFLVLRSTLDADGPPASVSVIGRNEARADYEVLYADERGVSRVYAMTFTENVWTQHRADPGFHQHFEARVESPDRIAGAWSLSHDDGATWQHDFDIAYMRAGEPDC